MHLLLILLTALNLFATKTYAAASYGNGTYTNICGTGTDASRNMCNQGCNINTGTCVSNGNNVVQYTCDGRVAECKNNEQSFRTSASVANTPCGKTVQIDVFTKTCRVNGGWSCTNNDLVDYFVWYSGDCPNPTATPLPTAAPAPTILSTTCDSLTVVSGEGALVPATIRFRSAGSGTIKQYRFYWGDGSSFDNDTSDVTHKYSTSGSFTVNAYVQDNAGNWVTSGSCQKTVTVKPIPFIESHKSDCSDLFITAGNQTQAPTTAKFTVNGYDNRGAIKKYKIDYGDGTNEEKESATFEKRYEKPGTYTVKAFILDTENSWKGGQGTCAQPLYVNTQPMQQQPNTGTPTLFTFLGIGSGVATLLLLGMRKRLSI